MDSTSMKNLIMQKFSSFRQFSSAVGVPHTTLYSSLSSDEKFDGMPISTFMKCADALDIPIEELAERVKESVEYSYVQLDDLDQDDNESGANSSERIRQTRPARTKAKPGK